MNFSYEVSVELCGKMDGYLSLWVDPSTNETRAQQGGTALETGSAAGYFRETSLLLVGCFGQTKDRDA